MITSLFRRLIPIVAAVLAPAPPILAQGLYPDDASYRAAFAPRCDEISEGMARRTWSPGEDTRRRA